MVLTEVIWFNSNIKVDSKSAHFSFFSEKNLNVNGQLFNENGNIKPWKDLKIVVTNYWCFAKNLEDIILKDKGNAKSLIILDHHIVRNSQIYSLNRLTNTELYLILVEPNTVTPTAQDYFENLFELLHNILYANKMLFKFGKVTSPRCSFC